MPKEITDEVIKKRHKEFNDDIQAVLDELQPKPQSPIQKMRSALRGVFRR